MWGFVRIIVWLAACIPAVLLGNSGSAAQLGRAVALGGTWEVSAWTDDADGEFSACMASALFKGRTVMHVRLDRDNYQTLGFFNPAWHLNPDREMPFKYRIDSGPWLQTTAFRLGDESFFVEMPYGGTLADNFRRGIVMDIAFSEGRYTFNLAGSFKATIALAGCVEIHDPARRNRTAAVDSPPAAPHDGESPSHIPTSGSGVIVSSDGIVLTNNHVVESCDAITVTQSGEVPRAGRVLRLDVQNDLAVIKVDTTYDASDVATFRLGRPGRAGETIAAYGFPLSGLLSTSGNIVSGNITALSGLQDDVRFFQISAPIQPGNSGGPLIDAGGLVLGIVNSKISDLAVMEAAGVIPQNVSFAIKGTVATSFLDAHSIAYQSAAEAPEANLADIADMARRFGVYIECP